MSAKGIPYRYQEILMILAENPNGLTTQEIFSRCRQKGGSELPDSSTTSQCIYQLKKTNKVYIAPLEEGRLIAGGAYRATVYRITEAGHETLQQRDITTTPTQPTEEQLVLYETEPQPPANNEAERTMPPEQTPCAEPQPTPDNHPHHSDDAIDQALQQLTMALLKKRQSGPQLKAIAQNLLAITHQLNQHIAQLNQI